VQGCGTRTAALQLQRAGAGRPAAGRLPARPRTGGGPPAHPIQDRSADQPGSWPQLPDQQRGGGGRVAIVVRQLPCRHEAQEAADRRRTGEGPAACPSAAGGPPAEPASDLLSAGLRRAAAAERLPRRYSRNAPALAGRRRRRAGGVATVNP